MDTLFCHVHRTRIKMLWKYENRFSKIVILAVLFLMVTAMGHDLRNSEEEQIYGLNKEKGMRYFYYDPMSFRQADNYRPIRVNTFHTSEMSEHPALTQLVAEVIDFLAKAVFVVPVQMPIIFDRGCEKGFDIIPHTRRDGSKEARRYCLSSCLKETFCGGFRLPQYHLDQCYRCYKSNVSSTVCTKEGMKGAGISGTDFVLYTSLLNATCSQTTRLASGHHCARESYRDRPIAGFLGFCEANVRKNLKDNRDVIIKAITHELLHVLVLAVGLFPFYRSPSGEPLSPRDENSFPLLRREEPYRGIYAWSTNVTVVQDRLWKTRNGYMQRNFTYIVLPKVREEARKHFACPFLPGAELENQGGPGIMWEHWEYRAFKEELMTAITGTEGVLSRITLALLEDSGWYRVNYSYAQPMYWGRFLGCDFAMKSCLDWMDSRRQQGKEIAPYCDKPREQFEFKCTSSRDAKGFCNLVKHGEALPPEYQYFKTNNESDQETSKYGAANVFTDYCPYAAYGNIAAPTLSQYRCDVERQPTAFRGLLETFSKHSRCIDSNTTEWTVQSCNDASISRMGNSPVCHEYTCKDGLLHMMIKGKVYPCFHENQVLNIQVLQENSLLIGTILCPSCNQLCPDYGMICTLNQEPKNFSYPMDDCRPQLLLGSISRAGSLEHINLILTFLCILLLSKARVV